jgi:hypothetical protein
VEDRISGIKDKIDVQGKIAEYTEKILKSYDSNMQELSIFIKRQNL